MPAHSVAPNAIRKTNAITIIIASGASAFLNDANKGYRLITKLFDNLIPPFR